MVSEAQVEAPHSVSLGRRGRTVGCSKRKSGDLMTETLFYLFFFSSYFTFFGLKTFFGPKTTHAMYTFALHLSQSHVKVPEAGILPIMVSYSSSTENSAWLLVSGRTAESKLSLKGRGQRAPEKWEDWELESQGAEAVGERQRQVCRYRESWRLRSEKGMLTVRSILHNSNGTKQAVESSNEEELNLATAAGSCWFPKIQEKERVIGRARILGKVWTQMALWAHQAKTAESMTCT